MQGMYSPYEPDVYIPYEELPPDVKQVLTFSVVCDEKWNKMYAAQVAEPDYDEMVSKMGDMALYSLEQSWVIPAPSWFSQFG